MSDQNDPQFGINSWLEEELYQNYVHDRKNVDESWKSIFDTNGHGQPQAPTAPPAAPQSVANGRVTPIVAVNPVAPSPVALNPSDERVPLRGAAAKIAENMIASLTVP